ncbi:MAG: hypothetical protein ACOZCL_14970 [Bacillota bacterium]
MLTLNKTMHYIRCSRYEYYVKKGSISNYSFNVQDEEKTGVLEIIFEKTAYPITQDKLVGELTSKINNFGAEKAVEFIDRLKELEIIQDIHQQNNKECKLFIMTDSCNTDFVKNKFSEQGFEIKMAALDSVKELGKDKALNIAKFTDEQLIEAIKGYDIAVVLKGSFSPSLFYRLNRICLQLKKKLVISYLDGNEGVIVPLLNYNQVGCYNDFEILRESSFYNLLDYQIMKEHLINNEVGIIGSEYKFNPLHFSALTDNTLLLLNYYTKYSSINYYAYSLDFERMVNTKTRLLKFPKCPSCQGDRNLVHAFI